METVDVVLLTKNSQRLLKACLRSVYENVPVNRLIVIDAFSTDDTLRILGDLSREYGNVEIISEIGSRGMARERGIREVETEWFLFVDSDVVLCKNWFEKASSHIREDVGAIWGVDIPGDAESRLMVKIAQWMEARVFEIRGGCHDILIRHDSVRDIRIPSDLHTLEDAYIKEWITAKGYKVVVSHSSYCRHYKTMENLLSKENRASTVREFKNMRLVRERFVYAAVFALMWLIQEAKVKKQKRTYAITDKTEALEKRPRR